MLVDIGKMKQHIKPKADSTLRNMRKDSLIEYIRTLEHNYNVAVSFNENQARYIESLGDIPMIRCKDCISCYKAASSSTGYRCKYWGVYDKDCECSPDGFCNKAIRRDDNA